MIFKIYDSDFGVKVGGVNYDFDHVSDLTIEDPENTRLTRGANASNTTGLVYKEGIREPKRWTVNIIGMSVELKAVLDNVYESRDRVDVYCISRVDGSSKIGRDAILCQQPQQLSVDDSPDSMNVGLVFETFNSTEVHKS
jgi:hypothetical protein